MNYVTISGIKRVIRELRKNNNYSAEIMRKALATVKEYDIDTRTVSYDGCDDSTIITALEMGNPGSSVTLTFRANSEVAYVLAGIGGAY